MTFTKLTLCIGLCVLALGGCDRKPEPAPSSKTAAPFNTGLSMKDLMKHVVDPAADIVWASSGIVVDQHGTTDLSPTTPEGWASIENHSAMVAESANLLMLPGRARADPEWDRFARQLHDAGVASMRAAENRDRAGLLRTGGDIYAACTQCHKRFVLGEK
jgi:hypothetical protein